MSGIQNTEAEDHYWSTRYEEERTGWNIGYAATPIKEYINQLEDKTIRILIPGAGNAYEAEYLFQEGFTNVFVLDISEIPLKALQQRLPEFPESHLIHDNFFTYQGTYDLILEQTFFCSFPPIPENRVQYGKQMATLLAPQGKLVGLWFDIPLIEGEFEKRPFGGTKEEYLQYLSPYFKTKVFEACTNSIPARVDKELFGVFVKK